MIAIFIAAVAIAAGPSSQTDEVASFRTYLRCRERLLRDSANHGLAAVLSHDLWWDYARTCPEIPGADEVKWQTAAQQVILRRLQVLRGRNLKLDKIEHEAAVIGVSTPYSDDMRQAAIREYAKKTSLDEIKREVGESAVAAVLSCEKEAIAVFDLRGEVIAAVLMKQLPVYLRVSRQVLAALKKNPRAEWVELKAIEENIERGAKGASSTDLDLIRRLKAIAADGDDESPGEPEGPMDPRVKAVFDRYRAELKEVDSGFAGFLRERSRMRDGKSLQ